MLGWAAASIGLAVAGRVLTGRQPKNDKKMCWWELLPVTPEVDPEKMPLAVSTLRKNRRKRGTVTIIREGTGTGSARLWLGIEGAANPERSAVEIAEASGTKLGQQATPPKPRTWRGWSYSTVWQDPFVDAYASPGYEREATVRVSAFADHANKQLDDQEMCVITARPTSDNKALNAAMLTTSDGLVSSWCDSPPSDTVTLLPRNSAWLAAAGLFVGLVPWLLAFSPLWTPNDIGVGALVVAVFGVLLSAEALIFGLRKPKALVKLFGGGGVPFPGRNIMSMLPYPKRDQETPERTLGNIPLSKLAGWSNGGSREAIEATELLAPDIVTDPSSSGASLGFDLAGRECFLDEKERTDKVFVLGDPGKGKTNFLLAILASDCRARLSGMRKGIFWVETKGEGAREAEQVIKEQDCEPLIFNADDISGPRLELVDWENPDRAAKSLVGAIRYAYGAHDIMEQSAGVLETALRAAVACPPEAAAKLGYDGRPNVMELAFLMIGGDPVAGSMQKVGQALGHIPEYDAMRRYTEKSRRDQEFILESSRNKLQSLKTARGLWHSGQREYATISDLLTGHHSVVLNFGPSSPTSPYDTKTADQCAAITIYLLWEAIKIHCDSWESQGRSTAIYCDELADIAGLGKENSEVIQDMAVRGRSRGVQSVFATQHQSQLPGDTFDAVNSAGTRAYFALQNPELAKVASSSLWYEETGNYSAREVASLPVGHCAIVIRKNGRAQQPFTLKPHKMK